MAQNAMKKEKDLLNRVYGLRYYMGGPREGWKKGYNEKYLGKPHSELHRWIHKFFPGRRSMLILGCALGLQVKRCLECGDPAYGIDWTPALGKHKLVKNVARASATHLPFRSGTFDLGVNVNLMEHIPKDLTDQVIREQGRVCRAHFFSIPCMTDFKQLGSFFKESGHVTFKTAAQWIQQLRILGPVEQHHPQNPYGWRLFIIRAGKEVTT